MAEATKKKSAKPSKATQKQAVIAIGGKQYLVAENEALNVEKLDVAEKKAFEIKDVLAVVNGDSIDLGTPKVSTKVMAEVVAHGKGEKIYIVKYKPKVRYKRRTGHRQQYTRIKITSIA